MKLASWLSLEQLQFHHLGGHGGGVRSVAVAPTPAQAVITMTSRATRGVASALLAIVTRDPRPREEVDLEHHEELETSRELLRCAIELGSHCDLSDTRRSPDNKRVAFLAHFSDWREPITAWDQLLERTRAAPGAIWGWLAEACPEHDITEPPVSIGPLIDRLAIITLERAQIGDLDTPCELNLKLLTDRVAGHPQVGLHLDTQRIARLPGHPADSEQQLLAIASRIQALFDQAQSTTQAQAVSQSRGALLTLKQQLLKRLAKERKASRTAPAADCPICQTQQRASARASG